MMWLNQSRAKVRHLSIGRKPPAPWRPNVEMLEDRRLLATPCDVYSLVDTPSNPQPGELRYCMNQSPDTIDIGISGTIQLKGVLPVIDYGVTITGPGAEALTIERAEGGDYRIFTNVSWAGVTIRGMTIRNGLVTDGSGGGGIRNDGILTIENSVIKENVGDRGGGIHNTGTLYISNSTLSNNTAIEGPSDVDQCPYTEGCASSVGGAIYNGGTIWAYLEINDSVISENRVRGNRENSQSYGLLTAFGGGGISNIGSAWIYDSELESNSVCAVVGECIWDDPVQPNGEDPGVWFVGGGISSAGYLYVMSSTISENRVGPVDISWLPYNHKVAGGGAFTEARPTSTEIVSEDVFLSCTISNNSVEIIGEFTVTDKNIASALGAGLHGGALNGRIENTTISNNVAYNGVGLENLGFHLLAGAGAWFKYVEVTVAWSTILFNTARGSMLAPDGGAGGVFVDKPSTLSGDTKLTLLRTIVARNHLDAPGASADNGYDIKGPVVTDLSKFNLIGVGKGSNLGEMDDPDCTANCNQVGSVSKPINPMLAPLANNACDPAHPHCPWTHQPYLGSPVIDKGGQSRDYTPPDTDERGQNRIVHFFYDIGSFECQVGECTEPMFKPFGGLEDEPRLPVIPPLPAPPSRPQPSPAPIVQRSVAATEEREAADARISAPLVSRLSTIKRLADMDWTAVLHDDLPLFGVW